MASFGAAGRLSARLAGRRWMARSFHLTSRYAVAHNFTMPALSPTMTEGNIATWQVKEGDHFAAGDVLLEIETDKATMDVEAQEDGQVFKILQANGTKGIPVGARIAVLAEEGDDLSSLAMPADMSVAKKESPAPAAAAIAAPVAAAQVSRPPAATATSTAAPAKKAAPQKYPLLPSVLHLIKEHRLDPDTVVPQCTPTGPGGRLLKGDVLAFLGLIPADLPAKVAAQIESHSHLDLSNIRLRVEAKPAKPVEAKPAKPVPQTPSAPATKVVSLAVSLSAVMNIQNSIQTALGVFMPVSTFVSRAADVANDSLPRAGPPPPPSADALFDEIVGISAPARPSTVSRGHYLPQISTLPPATLSNAQKARTETSADDVFDILIGKKPAATSAVTSPRTAQPPPPAMSTGTKFFTLDVPAAEEKQAQVFLERIKMVLENEPGRLVL